MKQNTRIAPSPTGYFHVGTARTAYHNWLVAKATGGSFTLRIDDTDMSRSDDTYVQVILDGMKWLGLDYDSMFRQSDKRSDHNAAAKLLLDKGLAIHLDNGAIALHPKYVPDSWNDTVAGKISIDKDDLSNIDGMTIVKADGSPVYNFASIVDDINSGVNRIIRGVDHIKNTPRQIVIAMALLDSMSLDIQFTHVGLIHNMDGKKISKRDGALSVLDYRDQNYHPDALLNLMLRLGWSPSLSTFDSVHKHVDKDLAIKIIQTDGRFNGSSSKLDFGKLKYYDKVYKRRQGSVG